MHFGLCGVVTFGRLLTDLTIISLRIRLVVVIAINCNKVAPLGCLSIASFASLLAEV